MRLIDADAFTEYVFDKWMQNDISNGDWTTFREWMNLQETVVEFDGDINKVMVKGIEYFPQKTGKWTTVDEQEPRRYGCSKCKMLVWHTENYCPNCGARMENES